MKKKVLVWLCVLAMTLSLGTAALTSAEESARPAPGVTEGERYVSDHLHGASALYVSGESVTIDNAFFYGAGFANDEDTSALASIPNKYGLCAVVLGVGQGTEVVLNNPVIESDPESYANGVFAAGMARITINGGTISTCNASGHGIDATYMGYVYASDLTIHTQGETSGSLATDFGGGFIHGERLDCTTEQGSSPGIFCAGSTVILLKDSKLTTAKATGIVVAHDGAVVVLDNCEVDAAGAAISGLQAFSDKGSSAYVFGGKLTSRGGAVVGQGGGNTVVNLIGAECTPGGDTAISNSKGTLEVNLWDTELVGNVAASAGTTVINIYAGGKLTGEVSGEGEVTINVYDGGEYVGAFEANEAGAGEEAPVLGDFDYYLVNCWASGSTWDASTAGTFVNSVEPDILANSAVTFVEEGAAAKTYDAATFDPSENGVDLSLLNIGSAYGFSTGDVFGGGSSSGAPSSDDFDGSNGGSSGAPSSDDFGGSDGGQAPGDFDGSNGGSAGGQTPQEDSGN